MSEPFGDVPYFAYSDLLIPRQEGEMGLNQVLV